MAAAIRAIRSSNEIDEELIEKLEDRLDNAKRAHDHQKSQYERILGSLGLI